MIAPDPRDEQKEKAMTTTFNAAATKTVGVNATNFEFTFTRLSTPPTSRSSTLL
jgi:hypothetical protein